MRIHPSLQGKLTLVAEGAVGSPQISGDGETVVYNEFKDGVSEIQRFRHGETVQLSTDGFPNMHPALSDDGETVVWNRYSSDDPDVPGTWDVVRHREGQMEFVAASDQHHEMGPCVSDDGEVIAWNQTHLWEGKWSIHKQVNGQNLAVTDGRFHDRFPELSGDGQRLMWRHAEDGQSQLWLQDQAGTVKPFITGEAAVISPSLTDDGTRVVYTSSSAGEEDLIWADTRDSGSRVVSEIKDLDESTPSISGDGSTIAWTGFDFRQGAPADTNIFLEMEGDGQAIQVTQESLGLNSQPTLSDDGQTLVWTWIDDKDYNHRKIFKLDLPES